ncbi:MAG: putative hydrolase [Myxococcota bacterium]|jgi:putative hydrolase
MTPTHNRVARISEDLHVHSTWSDGRATIEENLATAELLGLRRLGLVDHVRHDTTWVPHFVRAIDNLRNTTEVELICGVETRMLNEYGAMDLPDNLAGVDRVYIADHRLPFGDQCLTPKEVRELRRSNLVTTRDIVAALVRASIACMRSSPLPAVLAHWGSILPKIDIDPLLVTESQLDRLAEAALETGTWVEVDERWQAPCSATVTGLAKRGVTIVFSSDAHRAQHIGHFPWATTVQTDMAQQCGS